jgi:hypothetical protein
MASTIKGYPYPVGTDRVMDGDNAIQALAEAVEADACLTKAATTGQSVATNQLANVSWNAPTVNTCELTKTSASVFTVTKAGLYVVSACCITSAFSPTGQRSYAQLILTVAGVQRLHRQTWMGENQTTCTIAAALGVGDTIQHTLWPVENTSIQANTGWLHVLRLGRN